MSWPKLLVLVRHAESILNPPGSINEVIKLKIPFYKAPLTEKGVEQCLITRKYLDKNFREFDAYFTSYYTRAIETMKLLHPDAPMYIDDRLAEIQEGIWETMTKEQIQKQYPGEIQRKKIEDSYHHRPLGGENGLDIGIRIRSFRDELRKYWKNKRVFIVGHGKWMVSFQYHIYHYSLEQTIRRWKDCFFQNASITIYESNKSGLTLIKENFVPWKGII